MHWMPWTWTLNYIYFFKFKNKPSFGLPFLWKEKRRLSENSVYMGQISQEVYLVENFPFFFKVRTISTRKQLTLEASWGAGSRYQGGPSVGGPHMSDRIPNVKSSGVTL